MKLLMPVGLAVLGLAVGVGAGVALKPAPEALAAAACGEAAGGYGAGPAAEAAAESGAESSASPAAKGQGAPEAAAPCAPGGPLEPVAADAGKGEAESVAVVALDKPFVVPVFKGDKVVAMVVASVAIEIDAESETKVEAAEPKLRDGFLAAMFRHANSGGFEGAFTTGQKMDDLRAALLVAARGVFPGATVGDVLITEIAKQDV